MRNFFEDHKGAVLLIAVTLVLAILIGVFAALSAGEQASVAESAVAGIASPGQTAVSGAGNWLLNLFGYFGNIKALRTENEALKQENVQLDRRLRDAQGLELENMELRAMLELEETEHELDLVAAAVIAKDPSNWYGTFTINRGSDHGLKEGQAVLTPEKALVGKISRVGSDWAEVLTILDPECGVGAMIERSKDAGVLEGDSSLRFQGRCRLGYLSRDADVQNGDYIATSGMGRVYPKGLLIGKVLEIKEDNVSMSKYAIIEPVVNFSKLNQLFVLLNAVEVIKRADIDLDALESETEEENLEDQDEDETPRPTSTSAPSAPSTPHSDTAQRPANIPSTSTSSTESSNNSTTVINGQELRE